VVFVVDLSRVATGACAVRIVEAVVAAKGNAQMVASKAGGSSQSLPVIPRKGAF
jgi:hypothetical protein